MKLPLILRADDGIHWWQDAKSLESYVESPDIEDGIFTVWDAEGQAIDLTPQVPVKRTSFFGLRFLVSVSPGILTETGRYEPDVLHSVIAAHIKEVWPYKGATPEDLPSMIQLLCRLQSLSR